MESSINLAGTIESPRSTWPHCLHRKRKSNGPSAVHAGILSSGSLYLYIYYFCGLSKLVKDGGRSFRRIIWLCKIVMDRVNQKMRKFNLRGVLDGLRSSVSTPPKAEFDVEETLRSEHFQVAKVKIPSPSSAFGWNMKLLYGANLQKNVALQECLFVQIALGSTGMTLQLGNLCGINLTAPDSSLACQMHTITCQRVKLRAVHVSFCHWIDCDSYSENIEASSMMQKGWLLFDGCFSVHLSLFSLSGNPWRTGLLWSKCIRTKVKNVSNTSRLPFLLFTENNCKPVHSTYFTMS